ncbi:PucR family transcriptional regulator [Streptomyces caniscabiei]|uniref:PucR family transcriptional regulator n=1 Tax=Streptomyces caniscabiei TaxID=2746961 RepID=A0ABU4MLB5_9ACTN|nr:PucR family transcriptional regulator [Streptomyces caniscabiei]MBE4736355.1 PucR family transcriptional regulator [Streptomyces caniscabiei]MBE4761140.1 PucR family transcriptional regulator [Streptomyces caniscabiei]MBE4786618.1 PucR family transcriptional regulator [Streptomyces caniscabiei]MBE4799066.1 PucR family transcriptional regulator [Streptomyces caniscabiei]MDX2942000.1 PucR family transcriptional regulator [Streptomyces caniscabiei]
MDTRQGREPGEGREAQGGITVRRALELPGLRGGLPEVLAGADRLHRTVRWVHAGEVPNIASLLKGGELLLTTGYGLGTRPADQRAFVRTLAERGISALVVELGPRFTRLPPALVETARSAGLPLVQLHREVAFVTVTEEIHTEIVNGHYALLQQAEEVHRRCTEALLGGGGVPQVLGILADFSGNPVFLETPDGQLLYAAGTGPADTDPLQVWEGLRDRHQDEPPAGTTLVDVPGGGPGTGSVRARLVLLPVVAPSAPVHRMAAERAAGILAVVLMQARQEEELAARGRGDFLTDLAEGRVRAEDAPAQARVLGFKPGAGPLLPVVMRLADGLSPGGGWAVLARAVAEELASVGVPVLLGVRPVEGRVPLLLGLRAESERPAVADRVSAALRAGAERAGTQRPGGRPPVVVVGVPGGWAAASAGLRHAAETATAAQGLADRPWYDARRLDIDLLLWRLRDHPDLAAFVDRAIGPLRDHDERSRPPLLPTLETYLAHAGRKAETARELHLNRQTLYNRLARIGELLGTDLDDPQAVLALSLALRARRHVG